MAGIREMSTILTPPEDRHPVLTYVGAYQDVVLAIPETLHGLFEGFLSAEC